MTERTLVLNGAQACAAQLLSVETTELLEKRFGTGYPHFIGGESPKWYHNRYHGNRVGDNAMLLGSMVGLTPAEIIVCRLAGLAHDAVQDLGGGANEAASAEWFEQKLHNAGFEQYLVEMGGLAIVSTEARFLQGRLTHQRVIEMDFPSRQSKLAAQALTSADIGDAFLPMGPYDAHRLFQEINNLDLDDELPRSFATFAINQVGMVEEFTLPLEAANSVFCAHRTEVIRYAHSVAQLATDNKIPTLADLLRQDLTFARTLSEA